MCEWVECGEKMVKNGVITSDYAGTILSLGYAEGDTLNTSTAIASFADADAVTVTVSVSQEDVSTIAIGDVVNIVFSARAFMTARGKSIRAPILNQKDTPR